MDEMNNNVNPNENVENEQPVQQPEEQEVPQSAEQPTYTAPTTPPPVYTAPPAANNGQGMAIASLVLGIASLVLMCLWYLAIPCGIVGLILGIMSGKRMKTGMATAGVVLSIIGLVLSLIWIFGLGALILAGMSLSY